MQEQKLLLIYNPHSGNAMSAYLYSYCHHAVIWAVANSITTGYRWYIQTQYPV